MKIGNTELKHNIFLAPMAGVSDLPFRNLCFEYGCGFAYTEMVSAKGLYYKDKKTESLMKLDNQKGQSAIQIFGSEPDIMAQIIPEVMKYNPSAIDINMGCPTPKIVNNGDGSALMKNPGLVGRVIRAVSDAADVPVTVKFRKGWDEKSVNVIELAKIAEANGASAICVHGRTREQFYSGAADWDIIEKVVKAVSVPVIGNGDIFTCYDAKRMLDETGCAGVMVARGAQGNPFIFRQINELLTTGSVEFVPSEQDKILTAIRLLKGLVKEKGENRGVKEARKHIAWFIKGIRGSSELKNKIFKLSAASEVTAALEDFIQ
ncbi:MAG: tRNA dihydrouridine synthase DusB [Clostridia bacterium]|nr:tRNA dihydrouridine synthase DusB [Clostridia bacterium]